MADSHDVNQMTILFRVEMKKSLNQAWALVQRMVAAGLGAKPGEEPPRLLLLLGGRTPGIPREDSPAGRSRCTPPCSP